MGRQGSSGSGQAGELQRLRDEYARELQRTRETLGRMEGEQRSGQNMSTPETHEFSRSAPGTEAFKQDYSSWETLRRNVDLAMERYEASVSQRRHAPPRDRLDAGGSDRVPDAYRQSHRALLPVAGEAEEVDRDLRQSPSTVGASRSWLARRAGRRVAGLPPRADSRAGRDSALIALRFVTLLAIVAVPHATGQAVDRRRCARRGGADPRRQLPQHEHPGRRRPAPYRARARSCRARLLPALGTAVRGRGALVRRESGADCA